MSKLRALLFGIWTRFLAGCRLLSTSGGEKKFWSLLWRNWTIHAFIIFYISLPTSLVVLLVGTYSAQLSFYRYIEELFAFISVYSLPLSIFDIPNFATEKHHLNEYLRVFNPLRVFIFLPIRSVRNVFTRNKQH